MNNQFPRLITLLRQEKGISQKKAAQILEVSQALLSHYEKGIRECGLDFIIKCADYYNVSTDYLLGRTPDRQGAFIQIDELPDENTMGKENVFRGSMLPVLNKKLIINSLNIIFEFLQNAKNKELTTECSNEIMLAVYKVFRYIYSLNNANPDSLFAADDDVFTEYANIAVLNCDIKLKAISGISKSRKIRKADIDKTMFALNQSEIESRYPLFATSLFNLVQTAEINMGVRKKV